jgi:hypothetical protein
MKGSTHQHHCEQDQQQGDLLVSWMFGCQPAKLHKAFKTEPPPPSYPGISENCCQVNWPVNSNVAVVAVRGGPMHNMLSHVVEMSWHTPFLRRHKPFFLGVTLSFCDTKKWFR